MKKRYDQENATIGGVDPKDDSGEVVETIAVDHGDGGRTAAGSSGPDALGIYFDPALGHYKLDKRERMKPEPASSVLREDGLLLDQKVYPVRCGHK